MRERNTFEKEITGLLSEAEYAQSNAGKWSRLFPKAERSPAEYLLDGEAYFKSVIDAVKTAKTDQHYVYILGWMLDLDFELNRRSSQTLYSLLKSRADLGVEVRVLVWDNWIQDYQTKLVDAVKRLNALPNTSAFADEHLHFPRASQQWIAQKSSTLGQIASRLASIKASDPMKDTAVYRLLHLMAFKSLGAHHDKVVIVGGADGLVAFCGGMDFNSNRVWSKYPTPFFGPTARIPSYHDNACRVEGRAAYAILERFKSRWAAHPGASKVSLRGASTAKPKSSAAPHPFVSIVGTSNLSNAPKDRSLKEAYFLAIRNAEKNIYIEDQYVVNLDVARALNKKLKEAKFERLIIIFQNTSETLDILIPNRMRGEFSKALLDGLVQAQIDKIFFGMFAKKKKGGDQKHHPGLHAKTLIVDDELAIIGSANLNQRSFTCDSETCAVVFDDIRAHEPKGGNNFAKRLRISTWLEFMRPLSAGMLQSWQSLPTAVSAWFNASQLVEVLVKNVDADDYDEQLISLIKKSGVIGPMVALKLGGGNVTKASAMLSPFAIRQLFDEIWQHVIDPVFP